MVSCLHLYLWVEVGSKLMRDRWLFIAKVYCGDSKEHSKQHDMKMYLGFRESQTVMITLPIKH